MASAARDLPIGSSRAVTARLPRSAVARDIRLNAERDSPAGIIDDINIDSVNGGFVVDDPVADCVEVFGSL